MDANLATNNNYCLRNSRSIGSGVITLTGFSGGIAAGIKFLLPIVTSTFLHSVTVAGVLATGGIGLGFILATLLITALVCYFNETRPYNFTINQEGQQLNLTVFSDGTIKENFAGQFFTKDIPPFIQTSQYQVLKGQLPTWLLDKVTKKNEP